MAIGTITWDVGSAITISGTGSTSRTMRVNVTGVTVGRYYRLLVRGKSSNTEIGRGKTYAAATTITISVVVTDSVFLTGLLNAARSGSSGLKCIYTTLVQEYIGDPDSGGTFQTNATGPEGIATITPRATAGTCTDFNLDLTGDTVQATWTRPSTHSGWRIRIEFYVNDIECITRINHQSTMSAYTPSAEELTDMFDAMGDVSPGVIKAKIFTGWTFYSSDYEYDLSSSATTTTNTIIKSFAAAIGFVWIKVSGVMQKCEVYIKDTVMKRVHPYLKDTTWKESK
jgi:hypothetical protein